MSDIKDEEDLLMEEFDLFLTDEELERHEDYTDFELEEKKFWDEEKVIYDRIDLDENIEEEEE